jgi:RNA polymerase sigma-70 factor (ECF subfamily)
MNSPRLRCRRRLARLARERMGTEAEIELLARCRRGDVRAWDELFDRYYGAVGRFVFQLSPDFSREDTEEVCQEVFLSVVRSLGSFKGASQFQTWLFRIASNKARDFRERRSAAKRGGGQPALSLQAEDPEGGAPLDPPSQAPSPDEALMSAERQQMLRSALDRVGEPCQEILELRYFGDLSYEELAAALKLNPKTVSSRLSKCLARLEVVVREVFARGNSSPFSV